MRKRFDRFCFKHRDKGIPSLMLYIAVGTLVVYVMGMMGGNSGLYEVLRFDRALILQGQIWRLITYPLTYGFGDPNLLLVGIGLLCYYSLGQAMENIWGTFRFNLFYLSGVLLQDVFCMVTGWEASVSYLNLSLFLSYATLFPHSEFRLFFIIPIKAWILGLFDIALTLYEVWIYTAVGMFPYSLYPLVAIANYFLFFGKGVMNLIPITWKANFRALFRRKPKSGAGAQEKPKVVPFPRAGSYEASVATVRAPYTHKCTICGRTDESDPELEFRYCSRCSGYHCYCQDHISNHTHVE